MTTHTAIYSKCPSCHGLVLVQQVQGTLRCVGCAYDYAALAGDRAAREAWMLENMRSGPLGIVYVLHMHQAILALPMEESNAQVVAFAEANGIELPKGKGFSPGRIVAIAIGAVILLIAAIVVVGLLTS